MRPAARYIPPADDPQTKIRKLEEENEVLRDRIEVLERDFLGDDLLLPREWRLTFSEERVVALLLTRAFARKGQIMTALYRDREGEEAEQKILDVLICRIRKKLAPSGIRIQTIYGVGYAIDEPVRSEIGRALGLPKALGMIRTAGRVTV